MPVPVRDWISSAFRHAGNTALTLPHRNPGQPARRAPAEHKPHQGLPLTGTARRTRRHASSSGIAACQQFRDPCRAAGIIAARPGSLLGPERQAEHTDHVSHLVNPTPVKWIPPWLVSCGSGAPRDGRGTVRLGFLVRPGLLTRLRNRSRPRPELVRVGGAQSMCAQSMCERIQGRWHATGPGREALPSGQSREAGPRCRA
jgi:hypothetical protein